MRGHGRSYVRPTWGKTLIDGNKRSINRRNETRGYQHPDCRQCVTEHVRDGSGRIGDDPWRSQALPHARLPRESRPPLHGASGHRTDGAASTPGTRREPRKRPASSVLDIAARRGALSDAVSDGAPLARETNFTPDGSIRESVLGVLHADAVGSTRHRVGCCANDGCCAATGGPPAGGMGRPRELDVEGSQRSSEFPRCDRENSPRSVAQVGRRQGRDAGGVDRAACTSRQRWPSAAFASR